MLSGGAGSGSDTGAVSATSAHSSDIITLADASTQTLLYSFPPDIKFAVETSSISDVPVS